jgi:hypothetical protein
VSGVPTVRSLAPFAALVFLGCESSSPSGNQANVDPYSSLAALVSIDVPGATSARVTTTDGAKTLSTPYHTLDSTGSGEALVLGLAPETTYTHTIETSDGITTSTRTVTAATSALPPELSGVSMTITGGTPRTGYYLVSGSGTSTFAVDETGAIRWYHELGATTEEAKMQYDGSFTTIVSASEGWQPVPTTFARYTAGGAPIATYTATSPDTTESGSPAVYGDAHECQITRDADGQEHVHVLAYELLPESATVSTLLAKHKVLRQAPDGTIEFQWKSWSRFSYDDVTETIPVPGETDSDHSNALVIDPVDDNYVVSFRDLDAVIKVDSTSGTVLWQLGGKQSQFTIVGDPLDGFYGQHSVRVLPNNHLLLFDNGLQHTPPESRAVEYALDLDAKTATMVWEFRHTPALFGDVVGSVERWQNGHTLVAFAVLGVVDEVDESGNVVWEGQLVNNGANAAAYRVRFLPSLYEDDTP